MKIAVVTPAWNTPASGGRRGLHLVAKALRDAGKDAFVVGAAYEHDDVGAKIVDADKWEPDEDTVLVFPEGYADVTTDYYRYWLSFDHGACVVYVQNYSMVGPARPWETHYWSLGPHHRSLVRRHMKIPEDTPIEEIILPVDSDYFKPARRKVKGSIAYSPRVERGGRVLDYVVGELEEEFGTPVYRLVGKSREDVRNALRKADVVVMASPHEGQSCFSNEAMACECCLVTWPSGGLVDHCVHGHTALLVDQNNVKGLIDTAAGVITGSVTGGGEYAGVARKIGKNARTIMREWFSEKRFRESLLGAVERIRLTWRA